MSKMENKNKTILKCSCFSSSASAAGPDSTHCLRPELWERLRVGRQETAALGPQAHPWARSTQSSPGETPSQLLPPPAAPRTRDPLEPQTEDQVPLLAGCWRGRSGSSSSVLPPILTGARACARCQQQQHWCSGHLWGWEGIFAAWKMCPDSETFKPSKVPLLALPDGKKDGH